MIRRLMSVLTPMLLALPFVPALADEYSDTISIFKEAGESGNFFNNSYAYAVFPTIGKAAFVVGGA